MANRLYLAVLIIVLTVLALLWAKSCADKHGETPKISPIVQHDLDSLAVTRPIVDAHRDSVLLQVKRDSIARVDAERRARLASLDAAASKHRADSLAALAQTADEWKAAHDERAREAAHWHDVAVDDSTALENEKAAHARTRLLLSDEMHRRVHLEDVTVPGLQHDIAKLQHPCKFGFIPCPSRTVVGVISAAAGYVAGQMIPAR